MFRKILASLLIASTIAAQGQGQNTGGAVQPLVVPILEIKQRYTALRREHVQDIAVVVSVSAANDRTCYITPLTIRAEPESGLTIRYADKNAQHFALRPEAQLASTQIGSAFLLRVHADKKTGIGEHSLQGKLVFSAKCDHRNYERIEAGFELPVIVVAQSSPVSAQRWRYKAFDGGFLYFFRD